jgi:alpha-aminoadipate/glutamate carrier protein LysW
MEVNMPKTYCPECDSVVRLENPREGMIFPCPDCGVDLEVVSVDPFDVYFPYEEDDDWDDDDWDDEDEDDDDDDWDDDWEDEDE